MRLGASVGAMLLRAGPDGILVLDPVRTEALLVFAHRPKAYPASSPNGVVPAGYGYGSEDYLAAGSRRSRMRAALPRRSRR